MKTTIPIPDSKDAARLARLVHDVTLVRLCGTSGATKTAQESMAVVERSFAINTLTFVLDDEGEYGGKPYRTTPETGTVCASSQEICRFGLSHGGIHEKGILLNPDDYRPTPTNFPRWLRTFPTNFAKRTLANIRHAAAEARQRFDPPVGGFMICYRLGMTFVAEGNWIAKPDRPQTWAPDVFAVPANEAAQIYVTDGGNKQDGAAIWRVFDPAE